MRRLNDDEGATAVLVAVVIVVLIGMAAMVVDVGGLWSERRQLQNGADGGSLAVAQLCAAGSCSGYASEAQTYADDNSNDGASNLQEVCGSSPDGVLPACSDPPATTPSGDGWVMVETQTGNDVGSGVVPSFLAQALVPGYSGQTVHASSIANWGTPTGIAGGIALTFGECEWDEATDNGTQYASYEDLLAGIWPTDSSGASLERTIYFQNPTSPSYCASEPNGGDLPGGFGWLQADSGCEATTTDNWFPADPGVSASQDCKDALAPLVGHLISLPIYDAVQSSGNNGKYELAGYAAFFMTGYHFSGFTANSLVTTKAPCKGQDKCISGFFTQGLVPQTGSIGSGPSFGATVVGLAP